MGLDLTLPNGDVRRVTPPSVARGMSLGLSEKAQVDREPGSTLCPSAWFLEEIDDDTLSKVADLV